MKTVILRYKNRKLYNKSTGKYTTLPEMLNLGLENFIVIDYTTKYDITSKITMRAILEQLEQKPEVFEGLKATILERL